MVKFYTVYYYRKWHNQFPDSYKPKRIMISAGLLWRKTKGFTKNQLTPYKHILFMDSGGFQFFNKFGEFPYKPKEYLKFIEEVNPHIFANMDYPCEPEILKKHNFTIKDNIKRTLDNQEEIVKLLVSFNIKSKFLPVIQGWHKEDYIYCVKEMQRRNLITDYMAIGSVCRRNKNNQIKEIIYAIKNLIPETKLHCFGVKIGILNEPAIFNAIYSCDSQAWSYSQKFGRVPVFTGNRLLELDMHKKTSTKEYHFVACRSYNEYIEYLTNKYAGKQTKLK